MSDIKFEWFFEEEDFWKAQNSTVEDEIYGCVCIKTPQNKYLVDIHKEYHNSKDNGYDLEIYYEREDGKHGLWLESLHDIKSVSSMIDPLGKFKERAEKLLGNCITDKEKAA